MTKMVAGKECVMGVDVSRWQGNINYDAFPLEFAFIKASGGDGGLYQDPMYTRNAAGWKTPYGTYHFASLGAYDPNVEADFYCNVILNSPWASLPASRKLPPVLDWEPTRAVPNSGNWVLSFLKRVEARTGIRPMIYTGAYVALDRVQELTNYDLWLAAYTQSPPSCAPWGNNWSVWQYSSSGQVAGINGGVDSNAGTVQWFNKVTSGTGVPSTPIPEEDIMASIQDLQNVVNAAADKVIAAVNANKPEDNFWMGTDDGEGKIYIVNNGVKFHVPGSTNPDPAQAQAENDLRIDTLVKLGYDNRGIQTLALRNLPEAPFTLVAN